MVDGSSLKQTCDSTYLSAALVAAAGAPITVSSVPLAVPAASRLLAATVLLLSTSAAACRLLAAPTPLLTGLFAAPTPLLILSAAALRCLAAPAPSLIISAVAGWLFAAPAGPFIARAILAASRPCAAPTRPFVVSAAAMVSLAIPVSVPGAAIAIAIDVPTE